MSGEYSPEHIRLKQIDAWLLARDKAVASALSLLIGPEVLENRTDSEVARDYKELTEHYYSNVYDKTGEVIRGLSTHKQVVNRLLEPWLLIEIVLTSSYWNNFLKLRNHGGAQPEIHALAALVDLALESSQPEPRLVHLPFIESSSRPSPQSSWAEVWETSLLSSTECAQISYRDKTAQTESTASLALAHRLLDSGHYSPFEHVAFTRDEYVRLTMRNKDLERRLENLVSNLDPAWIQFRQVLSGRTL
jgi:thymidylate synthase ThyX